MNYYPFHLGDYATHTAHLEPMEDLAYRRMLDLYYRTEAPLPIDPSEIARLIRLRDHAATVRDVLNEFFTQTDDGWRHKRCDAELAVYAAMSEGGKRGAAKRWAKPSDSPPMAPLSPPYSPPNANQEPRTKNQEPRTTKTKTVPASVPVSVLVDAGFDEATAAEFIRTKSERKAPLTERAWRDHLAESKKAGWTPQAAAEKLMAKTWKGFEARYVAEDPRPGADGETAAQRYKREQVAHMTGGLLGRKPTLVVPDYIDAENTQRIGPC